MSAYQVVRDFEETIAAFAGSKFGVAVDTCTAAIFLCCKYLQVQEVSIPKRTYCSVPCSIIHAGGKVKFRDENWSGVYFLNPYPIVDSACRFRQGMYVPGTYWCLSFQYRKHIPIGRGGMILTDDAEAVEWFRLARFSGRHEIPLMEDRPAMVGWHCYMEPERAARGLTLFMNVQDWPDLKFDYPDLSTFGIYQDVSSDPSHGADIWRQVQMRS